MYKFFFAYEKPIAVLIADDNKFIREGPGILISETENRQLIGEAGNGEEAIAFALDLVPDLILMYINMVPVNGFEAARKILINKPAARINVVSLQTESVYIKKMISIDAKDYLTQSASPGENIKAIREVAAGEKYPDNDFLYNVLSY